MYREFEYKKQGDGSDSWTVSEWSDETKKELINRYMVYEDPTNPPPKVDMSNVDLTTMTDEQKEQLRIVLGL